ncbi:SRPBCC family protein [Rhizobium sp. KVB221]|uniref:SRPBCC family protein n=1 Tax=Rhizobium setariae TaxID=2801340 RepID=A0A936YSW1_9HYPH|nr:SRPBCC family protein [Rhizobium setariae]MBL0372087.1 SRPBCC family protein [Rhizobium setariae]
MTLVADTAADHELVLVRTFDAPAAKIYEAWTNPEILKKWFAPLPFTTPEAKLDVRVGGESTIVMQDEAGNRYPNTGVYLELVPNRKIVMTDAFTAGWRPSGKPFMVAEVLLEELPGGKTKYTATARHWTNEDKQTHEQMGFHDGWGQCADQLAALLAK